MKKSARLALALYLLIPALDAQLAPRYTLTRVNPPNQFGSSGTPWLTDSGFFTAAAQPGSALVGFAWTVGGGGLASVELVFPAPPGVPWVDSRGVAINAAGVAVGAFDTVPFTLSRGFRFQGGVTSELFGPEGTPGLPSAINRDGWIVGSTVTVSGTRAVLWSPTLVASYLDPLSAAHDINDGGAVLGSLGSGAGERAAILASGVLTELGDLDPAADPVVQGAALNNLGHAVGKTRLGGRDVAFRWTPTTGMTQLAPFALPAGHDQAFDLNDAGWVVGIASENGVPESVLWSPTNARTKLRERYTPPSFDPLALRPMAGFRINAAGQIAASANRHFQTSFVLLTPAELEAVALAPAQLGTPYEVDVHGAGPDTMVYLAGDLHDSDEHGYRILSTGPLGLSMSRPRILARARADAAGNAHLVWNIPNFAAGRALRLQAFQLGPTRVSQLLRETP